MRFLANENFPGAAVTILNSAGHDVIWIRTAVPGASDTEVLAWAARDAPVLLTFDQDFGELARPRRCPATCGVVLFRIPMPNPDGAATIG
jgi:predicted nuclease of predicted toxin-antitoxin system